MKNPTPQSEPQREHFKFASDILWVGASNIIVQLFAIFTLPALTQNYGTELYGVWTQIVITVGLLTPILSLHLSTATVRYLAAEDDRSILGKAFASMFWTIIAFLVPVLFVSYFFRDTFSIIVFSSTSYAAFIPLTLSLAGTGALYMFLLSYFRAKRRIKKLSIFRQCSSMINLALVITLPILGYPLIIVVFSQILVELTFIVILFGLIIKETSWSLPTISLAKEYLGFSIPQIPQGLILWILQSSDRYFIVYYLGIAQVGIYSASYNVGAFTAIFYTPISYVLYPTISRYWELQDMSRVKLYMEYSTKLFLLLAVPASVGLFFFSKQLLTSLATAEFAIGGMLTLLVAIGTLMLGIYQINVFIILLAKKTKWIPVICAVSAAINIGLNFTLIPMIGIMGGAISTLLAYFSLAVFVTLWARREVDYYLDFVFISKCVIASIVMALALFLVNTGEVSRIPLYAGMGFAIYLLALLVLRTFSEADKNIIHGLFKTFKHLVGL